MLRIFVATIIFLILCAVFSCAQETEINGVRCSVGFIQKNEEISESFPATTSVRLVVTGGIPNEKQGLLDILIEKAIDDTGKNLMPDTRSEPSCFLIADYREKFDDTFFEEDFAELGGTDSNATSIQELSGQIIMHAPGKDPQSKIIIPSFQKFSGKPLKSEFLEKSGISIKVQTADEYLASSPSDPVGLKSYKKMAAERPEETGRQAPYLGYDLVLTVIDTQRRFAGIELLDAKGNRLEMWNKGCQYSQGREMDYYVLRPDQPAPKDAALGIYLETEKSVVKLPFTLKNLR